jgi:2-oxoglutarate/2-oxoacid ferredoxin oxidoreductase subunit beta
MIPDINNNNNSSSRTHPKDDFLNPDAFPTVWCSGCGIGTALYALFEAAKEMGIQSQLRIFSGTGCTGKVADCLSISTHSIDSGFVVAAAAEWKRKNLQAKTVAVINNSDILLTGGKDILEAGRNRDDMVVVIINNLIYTVSHGQAFPLTPFMRANADGEVDLPFNIPYFSHKANAGLIARWNPLRAGWMRHTLIDALSEGGLSVVELISPCTIFRVETKKILSPAERMAFLNDFSEMRYQEPSAAMDLRCPGPIILGRFTPAAGDKELNHHER